MLKRLSCRNALARVRAQHLRQNIEEIRVMAGMNQILQAVNDVHTMNRVARGVARREEERQSKLTRPLLVGVEAADR